MSSFASSIPEPHEASGGKWTNEETRRLIEAVQRYSQQWHLVAAEVGTRTPTQCRKRWNDGANPAYSSQDWTAAEDAILLEACRTMGPRWTRISANRLAHRSPLHCKNRYDHLTRKARRRGSEANAACGSGCSRNSRPTLHPTEASSDASDSGRGSRSSRRSTSVERQKLTTTTITGGADLDHQQQLLLTQLAAQLMRSPDPSLSMTATSGGGSSSSDAHRHQQTDNRGAGLSTWRGAIGDYFYGGNPFLLAPGPSTMQAPPATSSSSASSIGPTREEMAASSAEVMPVVWAAEVMDSTMETLRDAVGSHGESDGKVQGPTLRMAPSAAQLGRDGTSSTYNAGQRRASEPTPSTTSPALSSIRASDAPPLSTATSPSSSATRCSACCASRSTREVVNSISGSSVERLVSISITVQPLGTEAAKGVGEATSLTGPNVVFRFRTAEAERVIEAIARLAHSQHY